MMNPFEESKIASSEFNEAKRKGLFWLVFNLVLIALLLGVISQSEWGEQRILPILKEAKIPWLVTGWLCMNLAIFVLGFRWRALLPTDARVSGAFLGVALSAALLLNYAIPGPFGELAASWFVSKRSDLSVTQALVAGTTARLLGLLSAAMAAVAFWPMVSLDLPTDYAPLFHLLVAGMALCGLFLVVLVLLPKMFLGHVKSENPGKGRKVLIGVLEALDESSKLGLPAYSKAFFWSIIGHVLAAIGVYLVVYSIYGEIDWVGASFSYLTMTCSSAFAFLIPGSQWPWDAVMATMLGSTTQLSALSAATSAVVLRLTQLAMMVVGMVALQFLMRSENQDNGSSIG